MDGSRYPPYGYFGLVDGHLALPVDDPEYISVFSRDFTVDRIGKSGLSVVIPYPAREINPRGCAESVIRHYFFPILAGRLVVEHKFDGKRIRLDAFNLDDYRKRSQWAEKQGLSGLMDLACWAIQQPPEAFIRLQEPLVGRRPKITEEFFEPGRIEAIRQDFSRGKRLAFHLPISVIRAKGLAVAPV